MNKGLSHFVAASFVEDKFGVVQKDLPDVLTMLLDLQTVKLCFIFFLWVELKKNIFCALRLLNNVDHLVVQCQRERKPLLVLR